jgi:hypothetical protein
MTSGNDTEPHQLQRIVSNLYGSSVPRNVVADLIKGKRRAALREVMDEGHEPAAYFGELFLQICREAGIKPEDVNLLQ